LQPGRLHYYCWRIQAWGEIIGENRAVATAGRHPDNTYSASTSSNLPGGLDSVNPLLSLSLSLSLTDTGLEDGVVGIHLLSSILQKNQSSSA